MLAEARHHLRKRNPESAGQAIDWRFDHIREEFRFGRIRHYEITHTGHPDPGDWHVVNAALQGNVDYLVTADKKFNRLKDDDALTFETHTADSFLILLDDSAPSVVRSVTADQLAYWRKKKKTFNLVTALRDAGAPEFAERVRQHLQCV